VTLWTTREIERDRFRSADGRVDRSVLMMAETLAPQSRGLMLWIPRHIGGRNDHKGPKRDATAARPERPFDFVGPTQWSLLQARSKRVGDVEKPRNPVIAHHEPARVAAAQPSSEGGYELLQQLPMPAEATLHRIGDDSRSNPSE